MTKRTIIIKSPIIYSVSPISLIVNDESEAPYKNALLSNEINFESNVSNEFFFLVEHMLFILFKFYLSSK